MTLGQLLAMDHYAAYVWTAYGITLSIFFLNIKFALRERKLVRKIIARHHES